MVPQDAKRLEGGETSAKPKLMAQIAQPQWKFCLDGLRFGLLACNGNNDDFNNRWNVNANRDSGNRFQMALKRWGICIP